MKAKKWLSLLLVLCMLCGLLAACGSSSSSSDTAEEAETSAEETAEEEAEVAEDEAEEEAEAEETVEEETPAEEAAEEEAEEAAEAEEAEETVEEEAVEEELPEVELPLTTEDVTFEVMLNFPGYLSSFLGTYANHTVYQYAQDVTGVKLEFLEISQENMSTQMSLIAAAGDYPDLIFDVDQYYAGGAVKALYDEFIMDISDLAEEYAPHYMAVVNSDDSHRKDAYDDDGNMVGVQGYNNIVFAQNGPIIRQDWLDELGLDTPVTVSDWYDVLTAFTAAYDLTDALFMTNTGQIEYTIVGAFGSAGIQGMYQIDGTVYSGYNDEGFREYLTTMHQWYEEGLIGSDFLSRSESLMDSGVEEAAISGKTGIFSSAANVIEEYRLSAVAAGDEDAYFMPLANPTSDDGEVDHFGSYRSYAADHCVSLSATCSDPVLAVQFLNYFFTDEGMMLVSYGLEGEAYEYDEDGNATYTDLILNNQEGIPMVQFCLVKYTATDMPSVLEADRSWYTYTDEQVAAQTDIWFNSEDGTYTMPNVSLTTDESEAYTSMEIDLETYVEECTVKFIVGDMDIETQWDEYIEMLDRLGIDDCIAIYQDALDRYNSR